MDNTNEILETIIDNNSIPGTLKLIENICYEKAAHASFNWQDETLSMYWEKQAKIINKCIINLQKSN